jgi:hypothetical protein
MKTGPLAAQLHYTIAFLLLLPSLCACTQEPPMEAGIIVTPREDAARGDALQQGNYTNRSESENQKADEDR